MTDIVGRLEWACWMAERGLTVFVLEAESKRPIGGHSWYTRNTTDPEVVSDWFDEHPNCNYAVHPGDKYVVIDLDRKANANGIAAFEDLCAEHGITNFLMELDTLIVRTPSGGFHIYFKTPFPCANRHDLPEGIDVRGAVGYVVGPGSENPQGVWKVEDTSADIMDLPEWLIPYLHEPGRKDPRREEPVVEWDLPENVEQAREWLKYQEPAVEGAHGDDHTYWVVCSLRDFGISENRILKLLNEGGDESWNAKCSPRWGLDELQVKIENSFEYAANRPGIRSVAHLKNRHQGVRPAGGYAFTNAQLEELHRPQSALQLAAQDGERVDTYVETDDEIPEAPEDEMDRLAALYEEDSDGDYWMGFEEFAELEKVREYLIKDWLIAHGITGIIAKRGTGKSTIALDIACHIATDKPWWGTPIKEGWKVIYICGEDDEGMILNCRAWAMHHGRAPTNDRFMVGRGILDLRHDSEELGQRLREMKEWAGDGRVLIVLDTWQRATAGLKSNADDEMELAVRHAETIARALNGPMLVCYHPPKDGRMTIRGSGVQEDTTSGIWHLEKVSGAVMLTIDRAKGRGEGNWRTFTLRPTDLEGFDDYGDKLQGIVVEKRAGKEDENTAEYQANRVEQRKAWAKAVFGVLKFHEIEESITAPSGGKKAISGAAKDIADYWMQREHTEVADKFCGHYMDELEKAKLTDNVSTWNRVLSSLEDMFCGVGNNVVTLDEGHRVAFIQKEKGKGGYFQVLPPA